MKRLVSMAVVSVLCLAACTSYEPPAADDAGGCPDYPQEGKDWQDPPAMNRNAPDDDPDKPMRVRGVVMGSNFDEMGLDAHYTSAAGVQDFFPYGWAGADSTTEAALTVCSYLAEKGEVLETCRYGPMPGSSEDAGGLTLDMYASTFLFRVYQTRNGRYMGSFTIEAVKMSCPGGASTDSIDMVGHIDPADIEYAVRGQRFPS